LKATPVAFGLTGRASVAVLFFAFLAPFATAAETQPNIIFLLADDQCTYSMGCYGTPRVKTPHLDRLAKDGMVFDKHYDTTAICMASRVNIMTGKYEYKAGCNFEHGPLLEEHWLASYPILMREAGYRTAFAGKFGFEVARVPGGKSRLPVEDFDVWGGGPGQTHYQTVRNESMKKYAKEYPHSTLSYGAFGRDFILDSAKGEQPFCLSISFKAPHHPTTPDPRFDHIYRDQTFVKPPNFGREYGEHFAAQSRLGRQYERFHSWHYSDQYDSVMATYYQQIYAIDVAVGMIREAIAQAGVADNTVVIYTSDNGFMCGSHGYGSKVLPYEESSRVPLIMYDPRVDLDGGTSTDGREPVPDDFGEYRRCDALTGNVDIAPTLCALAGIEVPEGIDGKNLSPLYSDPDQEHHTWLPLINVWGPSEVHSLGVVTRDWKFIRWPSTTDGMTPAEELYHLETDPIEITNLIGVGEFNAQRIEMQSIYDQVVDHWQSEGVKYHNYEKPGLKFKR
jgi:arylsulfatase A-like enzyme